MAVKNLVNIIKEAAANFSKEGYRKKIHIRLDDDLHRKLRLRVANESTTIQNYITDLIRKSLE